MRSSVVGAVAACLLTGWGAGPGLAASPEAAVIRVEAAPAGRHASGRPDRMTAPTLAAALDLVASLRADDPGRPIVVQLSAGLFRLREAARIEAQHGGTASAPLVIRGAPGGGTVLSGSLPLEPLADPLPDALAARLPEAARRHVRLYRLPAEALASARALRVDLLSGPSSRVPLEVYDAMGALVPARWPKEGWAEIGAGSQPPASPGFTVDPARAARWRGEPDLWAQGYFRYKWLFESVPVADVEARSGRLRLAVAPNDGIVLPGTRVRVVHALSELDAPGEWWRDEERGLLVAWPRDPAGRLEVAVAPGLLDIARASHVRVDDIAFEHALGDAVTARGGDDVALRRDTVRWVAGRGMALEGMTHSLVADCTVLQTGATGLGLAGGDRPTLQGSGDAVRGSLFAGYGRLALTQQAGLWIDGVGIRVSDNLFRDAGQSGIVIHGNDHLVSNNEFARLLGGSSDIGAIYAGRDWTARGTRIVGNFLHDIRADPGFETKGVYLDDEASGFTVADNLFLRVDQAVFIGGGRDNAVENNAFVDSSPAIHVDSRGQTWAADTIRDPGSELRAAYASMPVASGAWRRRYPGLADILSDEPAVAKNNRLADNLFVLSRPTSFDDGGQADRQVIGGGRGPDGIAPRSGGDLAASVAAARKPSDLDGLVDAAGAPVFHLGAVGPRR